MPGSVLTVQAHCFNVIFSTTLGSGWYHHLHFADWDFGSNPGSHEGSSKSTWEMHIVKNCLHFIFCIKINLSFSVIVLQTFWKPLLYNWQVEEWDLNQGLTQCFLSSWVCAATSKGESTCYRVFVHCMLVGFKDLRNHTSYKALSYPEDLTWGGLGYLVKKRLDVTEHLLGSFKLRVMIMFVYLQICFSMFVVGGTHEET